MCGNKKLFSGLNIKKLIMEKKFELRFTVSVSKIDNEGFLLDTNLDSTIVGEFTRLQVESMAAESVVDYVELLRKHVNTAIEKGFSLD